MPRFVMRLRSLILLAIVAACTRAQRASVASAPTSVGLPANRAGIAVVASGGISGWQHVTLLDSASARFVTVTRRDCRVSCAPLDSAAGILAAEDVTRIYAIADSERVTLEHARRIACANCGDQAIVTTAVFGNQRRTVIRSDRDSSPEVSGRVNVALAEAIRAARTAPTDATTGQPNE